MRRRHSRDQPAGIRPPPGPALVKSWRQDVIVITCLVAAALAPLAPVFGLAGLAVPVATGLVVGAGLALLGVRLGWSPVVETAAGLLAYLAVGQLVLAVTGGQVNWRKPPWALGDLMLGLTAVWKRLVTVEIPVGGGDGFVLAPLIMALVAELAALSLALRLSGRRAGWALLVPMVTLGLALVLGAGRSLAAWPIGLGLAFGALAWTAWRGGSFEPRRFQALALCLVVAAGAADAATWVGQLRPRLVVRQLIEPPFDPAQYPSPLAAYRHYVKDLKQSELLRANSLPAGANVTLAVMDRFDGVVWNVAGSGPTGSGRFQRMAQSRPLGPGQAATVSLTSAGQTSVWLYSVGQPSSVSFTGRQRQQLRQDIRVNRTTGGLVLPGGVARGTSYTVNSTLAAQPSRSQIAKAGAQSVTLPSATSVPDSVRLTAAELTLPANTAGQQALALEQSLHERGYFSHGQAGEATGAAASPAGHGAARIDQLLTGPIMVGDAEQYASAMALMARELGLPARVAMGFAASQNNGPKAVFTGQDMTAWVEIAFEELGWVAFYPTPESDKTPDTAHEEPQVEPRAQIVQPPPATAKPAEPPDTDAEQAPPPSGQAAPPDKANQLRPWMLVSGGGASLIGLMAGLGGAVALVKAARRRRRACTGSPNRRVVAGWDELEDHISDLGLALPTNGTRIEKAAAVEGLALIDRLGNGQPSLAGAGRDSFRRKGVSSPRDQMVILAARSDQAAFGPGHLSETQAQMFWHGLSQLKNQLSLGFSRMRRLWAKVSPRSLRHRPNS
ncbi:MAG: hypothetical protein FWD29_08730 [Micrococcales bacterium]|nr:hypothetical protein [Micrococcales bacterium]